MAHSAAAIYRNDPNLQWVEPARVAQWQGLADHYLTTVPAAADATFRTSGTCRCASCSASASRACRCSRAPPWAASGAFPAQPAAGVRPDEEHRLLPARGAADDGVAARRISQPNRFHGHGGRRQERRSRAARRRPIADSANLAKIAAVFVEGRYQSKAALTPMLADTGRRLREVEPDRCPGESERRRMRKRPALGLTSPP